MSSSDVVEKDELRAWVDLTREQFTWTRTRMVEEASRDLGRVSHAGSRGIAPLLTWVLAPPVGF